jgi:ketosteroid isomerase-like protein
VSAISTEDRMAINDLLVSFAYAADALGDGEAISALFTEDAVYDLTGFGLSEFTGRPAIRDFFRTSFAATQRNVHFISNIKVHTSDSTSAVASCYVHAFSHTLVGGRMDLRARYDVDLRKVGDGWKFSRMGIAVLPV